MRLIPYKLTQLAVLAKILCLLMVLPPTVCGKDVRLHNVASKGNIKVYADGNVTATDRSSEELNLRFVPNGFDKNNIPRILIQDKATNMYLCFNKSWVLVGYRYSDLKAREEKLCNFFDSPEGGYYTICQKHKVQQRSEKYCIEFNERGKQRKRPHRMKNNRRQRHRQKLNGEKSKWSFFVKYPNSQSIDKHNEIMGNHRQPSSYANYFDPYEPRAPHKPNQPRQNKRQKKPQLGDKTPKLRHSHSRNRPKLAARLRKVADGYAVDEDARL